MNRSYDEYDQSRPLSKGALDRFLAIQDRIGAILGARLEAWYQAEHDTGTPYGSHLVSVDGDGLHYEVKTRDDWWARGHFTVPLDILTDPDFEANCAAKVAARERAAAEKKTAEVAAKHAAAETHDRREFTRLAAKYAGVDPTADERSVTP